MKSLLKIIAAMAFIAGATVLTTAPAKAQHEKAPSVAGTWTMTVEGSPHGTLTMGLTLKQDGKSVTGTFASPHGDMAVTGELAEGTLTLAAAGNEITFTAKLTDQDTLTGFLSSTMGDMKWTAKRVKDSE